MKFLRELKVIPSWDYRDDPKDQQGAHGAELQFILKGFLSMLPLSEDQPDITLAARVGTSWMLKPLAGPLIKGYALEKRGKQIRSELPGLDNSHGRGLHSYGVSIHSTQLLVPQKWEHANKPCEFLGGVGCYGETTYQFDTEILEIMVGQGSDAVWELLEEAFNILVDPRRNE